MEITGRTTADASIKRTTDNRELVTFTLVLNDYFKPKNGEPQKVSTFIDCSYWISTKIAAQIKKGCILTVHGRIDINAYKTKDGEFHAHLVFHCNHIKIVAKKAGAAPAASTVAPVEETEDLPF